MENVLQACDCLLPLLLWLLLPCRFCSEVREPMLFQRELVCDLEVTSASDPFYPWCHPRLSSNGAVGSPFGNDSSPFWRNHLSLVVLSTKQAGVALLKARQQSERDGGEGISNPLHQLPHMVLHWVDDKQKWRIPNGSFFSSLKYLILQIKARNFSCYLLKGF